MPPCPLLEEKPGVATGQTCYPRRQKDRKGKKTMERFIFGVLLVVALSLSGTGADPRCPRTWSFYKGHCYKVFKEFKNWDAAENFCKKEEEGGHLVSIQNKREADFVAKLVPRKVLRSSVWIGLSAQEKSRIFKWSDGSRFNYKSWARGQPKNFIRKKNCVALLHWSGYRKWNNLKCRSKRRFICKYKPQGEGSTW